MTERVDSGWSVREFHGLDLSDERLNRRLRILAEAFGVQSEAPINQASADWQDTKAAYAFFAHPKAQPADYRIRKHLMGQDMLHNCGHETGKIIPCS